jgi:hypothetical protein
MISILETMRRCGLQPSVAQAAFARALFGEPLDSAEAEAFRECAGRDYSGARFEESTGIMGRKSGKTEYIASPVAIHLAAVEEREPGTVLWIAPSKSDQARLGWQAVNRQLQRGFPNIIAEIKESEGRILLHNDSEIRIASANFRTLRGPKYIAVIR